MKFLSFILTPFFILSLTLPSFTQTCTSSGGDMDPDLELEPYRFRCGTGMMNDRYRKFSADFKLIKSCNNYYSDGNYYRNKGKIYYSKEYGEHEVIAEADSKTFKCVDGTPRDKNNVYFKGKPVKNIDKASFKSVGFTYCSDNNNVFYRNRYNEGEKLFKMDGAVSSSFELIGETGSGYAKDEKAVYYNGKKIDQADPASFKTLEYSYAHDNNFVYYSGVKVEGMKGANFEILKDCYLGSDGISLCNRDKLLKNSDAKSFKAIECGYYKDNNNVYINGSILQGVDPKTFEILSWGFTKDKNAVYCDLKLITGADPTSFTILGRKHSKDNKNVFFMQQLINCDYKSFKVSTEKDYLSNDKKYKFKKGVRIN